MRESGGAEAAESSTRRSRSARSWPSITTRENEDKFSERKVEPYRLENGREGWYAECFDLDRKAMRHFKLDRIKATPTGETFEPRPEAEAGRGGRLDERRPGPGGLGRPGLGLTRALPLDARGAQRGRRTADGAVVVENSLRRHILAGPPEILREQAIWSFSRAPQRLTEAKSATEQPPDQRGGPGGSSRAGKWWNGAAPGFPGNLEVTTDNPGPMTWMGPTPISYGSNPCWGD